MEEKNTPERNGNDNKKQKSRPRRHGYFIEPPTNKSAEDTSSPNSASSQKPNAGTPHGQKQGKHHHNKSERADAQRHEKQDSADKIEKNEKNERNDKKTARPHGDEHRKQNPHKKDSEGKNNKVNRPTQGDQESKNAQGSQPKKNKNRNKNKHKPHNDQSAITETKTDGVSQKTADSEKNTAEKAVQTGKKRFPGDKRTVEQKSGPVHVADDYEEYKLAVDDDVHAEDEKRAEEETPKTEVVGIRFKSTGKVYYFDPSGKTYPKGSKAIVDTARGQEFGEVAMTNSMVRSSDIVPPLRTVIRAATEADIEHHKENKRKEEEAFKICNEKIAAHKLDMKLIDAQYTFDNTKLLFYFTSSDRVDFRNLVKDLASVFRTRIELRQIGIRDEAKLMGGLGMCGRPLCCTLFLSDFDQVSIKMAKEQNLSLNSAKISGICGRLMCCLRYEHEAYEYEIKRTPPVDSLVRTENGDGVVTEISPLQGIIKVRLLASPEVPPKTYKRDEVTMLRKKQNESAKE